MNTEETNRSFNIDDLKKLVDGLAARAPGHHYCLTFRVWRYKHREECITEWQSYIDCVGNGLDAESPEKAIENVMERLTDKPLLLSQAEEFEKKAAELRALAAQGGDHA